MRTIKRYTNRKLYDPQESRYITLEELGELIRQGEEIEVRDHITGADLTTLVMLQTVLDQERRQGACLSKEILRQAIQAGEGAISQLRYALDSFINPLTVVETEIIRRLDILVKNGTLSSGEGDRMRQLLLSKEMHTGADGETSAPVTRDEVENLLRQIEELSRRIDGLM